MARIESLSIPGPHTPHASIQGMVGSKFDTQHSDDNSKFRDSKCCPYVIFFSILWLPAVMYFPVYILAVLASYIALTAAAPPGRQPSKGPAPPSPPLLSIKCYTKMGPSSGLWNAATTWSTRYQLCTSTLTSTATATLTPVASTSTITVTSTATITGSTSFSTAIQTTTVTSTTDSTTTTDTTTTTTTIITLSASTTTVAAPATFTPVETSLPGSTYSGSGGPDPISKREAKAWGSSSSSNKEILSQPGLSEWRYPQGVVCHLSVSETCSTKTTITTSTITATAETVTSTSTSTTTTTVNPSGTTTSTSTVTTTTTSVITQTSTSTSTSTATEYITTTTLYAACATNNLAGEPSLSNTIEVFVWSPPLEGRWGT
ncbi:hypothetical protein CLAIMM_09905 isoform 2 [Cladophialophora immunda]|nr:hypothetical protein CLAIMM_09905 isoform 2 [Cladophialophora immunda]